jgi:NAD(P)-dependent dehydrogenase (short-subunit alcohol dehydrogenase family)
MGTRERSRGVDWLAMGAVAYLGWQAVRQLRAVDLRGKVVAITGGSRGLGFLLAQEFARHGCRIAICARDEEELKRAGEHLVGQGAQVLASSCDVSSREEVERWIRDVERAYGDVDVLVNNASVIQVGPLEAMTLEDFEEALAINFWGGVYTTLTVLPRMRERRAGRIVNITSIGGKVAIPHLLPYDCAKFAAVGFSEGLRAELAKDGITVTTVVPGLMRTGSPVNAFFKGDQEKEFAWFSVGDATPVTAMDARRAARLVVEATRRGDAEITLSWQARLLRLTHDLFPGTTADLMGLVNRLLPDGTPASGTARGMELATPISPSPLTAMMNRAAKENNEFGGKAVPSEEHADRIGLSGRRGAGW